MDFTLALHLFQNHAKSNMKRLSNNIVNMNWMVME